MKKLLAILLFFHICAADSVNGQQEPLPEIYLITCGPGTATYSIYGHSALRVVNHSDSSDLVYNWGVFDFSVPNFGWRFARGHLDYMLAVYPYESFLQEYFFEQRAVWQQKINLNREETEVLLRLISENLKPENVKYRYDFFYDDCSTRIRDLLEKTIGPLLVYNPLPHNEIMSFRDKVGEYQRPYPWLHCGVDLLMGLPGDKKAGVREVMFLPVDMQEQLSEALINRGGKMIPLFSNPQTLLDFPAPGVKKSFISSPLSIFSLLFIIIMILTATLRTEKVIYFLDISIYVIYSLLALLVLFLGLFSDHQQMKWNLNLLWLNPFIIPGLISLILRKNWFIWHTLIFFTGVIFFLIFLIFPGGFNNAFLPLVLIILLRSSARAGFEWNPMSAKPLT